MPCPSLIFCSFLRRCVCSALHSRSAMSVLFTSASSLILPSFEAKQYMDLVSFRISPNGSRQSAGLPEFHAALHSDLVRHMRLVLIWHFAFSNKSVPFCWFSLGLFCSFVSDGMWGLNLGVRFGSSFCLLPCCTFTVPPSNLIL